MTVIEKIQEAAVSAPPGILDQKVYQDTDLMLYELGDLIEGPESYVDVPLKKIVALGRGDLITNGVSWREETTRLHGRGWRQEVFNYFEDEWHENSFPAPNSQYEFRLAVVGGVCVCTNGTHRLVAGKSWLVNKYGDGAVIKKAKIRTRYSLPPGLHPVLEMCAKNKIGLWLTPFSYDERRYRRINGKVPHFMISIDELNEWVRVWDGENVTNLVQENVIIRALRWLCRKPRFSKRIWHYIPHWIIIELLDDEWLSEQRMSARHSAAR